MLLFWNYVFISSHIKKPEVLEKRFRWGELVLHIGWWAHCGYGPDFDSSDFDSNVRRQVTNKKQQHSGVYAT